jgi:microcystin degradation protein MlrC
MARLAVARLRYCCNSFNARPTRLEDMAAHEWRTGPEAMSEAPDGSELQGVAAFLAARPGWKATVLRCASAPPGGPLADDVFEFWLADVEAGLRAGGFDAVFVSLHGACQSESDPSADVTILRRMRAIIGRMPLAASLDASANLAEAMPLLLDGASASRSWPAGDGDAAAQRALAVLEGLLAGRTRPIGMLARVASLLPSLAAPLAWPDLLEDEIVPLGPDILDASIFAGFPWADSRQSGASALVWTDRDAGRARGVAQRLAQRLAQGRAAALWRPEMALAAGFSSDGRFALLDPADDPLLGGTADTPGLLAAMVGAKLAVPAAFGVLHDPATVAAARFAGVGGGLERHLAATVTAAFGPPVAVSAVVEAVVEAGPADPDGAGALAVLRHGMLRIVVAERRPRAVGLELFARAGVRPDAMRVLALKAGATFDFALAELFPEVLSCVFPGPAASDLLSLPYRHVPAERRTP